MLGPLSVPAFREWLDVGADQALPAGHHGPICTIVTRGLLRDGHELVAATLDPDVEGPLTLRGPQLALHVLPMRPGGRGRDGYRAERRLLAAAMAPAALDVAHAWWTYEYALAAQAAMRVPVLVGVHDWAPTVLRYQLDPYRGARLAMQAAALARARHLAAPSPYLARLVQRWTRRAVTVIANCVDDERFAPDDEHLGRGRERILLSVNDGFQRRKNVTVLLQAFARLRRDRRDVRLVLLGMEHEPGGPAATWARAQGLDSGVEFLGRRPHEEVSAWMRRAAVLVHPALEETFGMVLVEAMAQGTPVVAGRRSGAIPWVLAGGRGGCLVDVTDAAALAAATGDLLDDPARGAALGRAGHALAWARYRTSAIVGHYLDAYARLIVRPRT